MPSLKRCSPFVLALLLVTGMALPLPARAAATAVFNLPAEGAAVKSPVTIDVALPTGSGSFLPRLEVAHGKNATSGFIPATLNPVFMPGNSRALKNWEWDATGFNPGPYTLHFIARASDADVVLSEGFRNVVLDGPDYAPKVQLSAPAAVAGAGLVGGAVVDDDLAGWKLEAVDSGGVAHPVASGTDAAAFPIQIQTGNLEDGTYTLRLTAWDRCANQTSAEQRVAVSNPAPTLRVGMASVDPVATKLPVTYTAASGVEILVSVIGDGGRILAEGRARGEGGENTVDVPVNLRGLKPGRYDATVTVKDQRGRVSSDHLAVIVGEPGPAPVVEPFPAYTTGDFVAHVTFPAVEISRIETIVTDAGGSRVIFGPNLPLPSLQVGFQERPVREGRFAYRIVLHLADGRIAESEERVTTVDLRPPAVGDVSVATVDGVGLNMRWAPATDTVGLKGYEVILVEGGAERVLATLGPEATAYATALPEGEYGVALAAVDLAGHRTNSRLLPFRVQAGAVALMRAGKLLPADVPGFVEDGRTWVPLRLFGEALGYKVTWDPTTQTATIVDEQGGRTMLATVGETRLRIRERTGERAVEVPAAPRLVEGRVLVPLRALAEALGAEVTWHQELRTVELK